MSTKTLSVALPNTAVYVSGTVNGTATTWTLNGNEWQTIAERDPLDIYRISLTAITASGSSFSYELTLYYGLHLITDRTQSDVDYAVNLNLKMEQGTATEDEQSEWFNGLKGAYNESDLNRVGAAVQYLKDKSDGQGYLSLLYPKTDWIEGEAPYDTDLETYLENIRVLRSLVVFPDGTPAVPDDMEDFTIGEANDIEKILEMLDLLLTNASKSWIYSGEIYAGENW